MTWDRNWGCRVENDSQLRGWAATVLQNELLRVTILNGKGCDVVEMLYKPRDIDITPRTQRGLRSRDLFLSAPWSEEGSFIDNYEGGWQEIFPHGGPPGNYEGASFPQHGESSRLPWAVRILENSPECVSIEASVRLAIMPISASKRFTLRRSSPSLDMETTVTNESSVELPIMWGHHVVFGAPAFGPGSTLEFPPGTSYFAHEDRQFPLGRRSNGKDGMWPVMVGADSEPIDMTAFPERGTASDLHYLTPSEGWYLLHATDIPLSVSVTWDLTTQPYVWFWQQFGAWKEYPWWGTEYLVGLEPWTSAPGSGLGNQEALKNSPRVAPGESLTAQSTITIKEDKK